MSAVRTVSPAPEVEQDLVGELGRAEAERDWSEEGLN